MNLKNSILNKREQDVLEAVITYYLNFGEAVGSRTLVKRYALDSSPATIRNVMFDLEERGFIEKRHLSSGRVPTSKGYKYYIDYLLKIQKLSKEEAVNIKGAYKEKTKELEELLSKSTKLLSEMTNFSSIALEPAISQEDIKKVEFVSLDEDHVLAVLVTKSLSVQTSKIKLSRRTSEAELKTLSENVNNAINSNKLSDFISKSKNKKSLDFTIADRCFGDIKSSFHLESGDESSDTAITLASGEMKRALEEMVKSQQIKSDKINIILGEDLNIEAFKGMTLILSSYTFGNSSGVIGVVGPTRMEYSKVAGLVNYVAKEVTGVTKKSSKEEES